MNQNIRAVPIYLWGLLGVAIVANLLGFIFNLWATYPLYDDLMHLLTPFSIALCLAHYLTARVLSGPQSHSILWSLVLVSTTLGIGAVWELLEWLVRQLSDNQEKKLVDTIIDLSLDLVGASLAVMWAKSTVTSK